MSVPTRIDGQNRGQGQGNGGAWRNGHSSARRKGCGMGYSSRPKKLYNEAHQMNGVYNKMSMSTRMAGINKEKGKVTDSLGAMVVAVPRERAAAGVTLQDPNKTYSKANQMSSVYNKMPGPTRMAGANKDKGEAIDVLDAMVAVVPMIVWAMDIGTLQDPK